MITGFAMFAFCHLAWGQKTVSDITAVQRPGTKLVDISYKDISYNLNYGDAQRVKVGLQVSSNGGTSWNVIANSVTGDVGLNVVSGAGKRIVWDAGADWNGQNAGNILYRITANDLDEMAFIPAGNFLMGDTSDEGFSYEKPTRSVYVSGFLIAKTEVTKAQWDVVATWAADHGYEIRPNYGEGKAADHPVQDMHWRYCVEWCNAKSEMEGLTPVYMKDGSVLKAGDSYPDVNFSANGYRLPTEAEWEKAARGGLSGKHFPWGDTIDHSFANYRAHNSYSYDVSPYTEGTYHPLYNDGIEPYTSPVGSFAGNGYGLFDMAGNVEEFCGDWYGEDYYGESNNTNDPVGPPPPPYPQAQNRVLRGGGYRNEANSSRVAARGPINVGLSGRSSSIGFRIVRRP